MSSAGMMSVNGGALSAQPRYLSNTVLKTDTESDIKLFDDGSYYRGLESQLADALHELGLPLDCVPFSSRRPNPNKLDGESNKLLEELR